MTRCPSARLTASGAVVAWTALVLGGCAVSPEESASQLERLDRAGEVLNEIWPGYDPAERPLGSFREDDYLLVWHPNEPPPGFQPLTEREGTDGAPSDAWIREPAPEEVVGAFHMRYPVNGETATLVREISDEQDLKLLIHEDFHDYQHARFGLDPDAAPLPVAESGERGEAALAADLRIERRLLQQALAADGDERHEQIHDYLALRADRERELDGDFRKTESHTEVWEGTATWVSMHALDRVCDAAEYDPASQIRQRLDTRYETLLAGRVDRLITLRTYATGSALAELLEQEWPGTWQAAVEAGERDLRASLAAKSNFSADDGRAERVREREGHADLREDLESDLELIQTEALVAALVERNRWVVTLELPDDEEGPGEDGDSRISFTAGFRDLLPNGDLFFGQVDEFHVDTGRIRMTSSNPLAVDRSLVTEDDPDEDQPLRIHLFQPRPVEGNGRVLAPGSHEIQPGSFYGRGTELEGEQTIRVEVRHRPRLPLRERMDGVGEEARLLQYLDPGLRPRMPEPP